jgi:putative oxidoreductase
VLEVFGGILILLGLFTRPVAFILSGQMAVAYFWIHLQRGFWPWANGGELAVLYCFAFLFFATAGSSAFGVDNALAKPREGSGVAGT